MELTERRMPPEATEERAAVVFKAAALLLDYPSDDPADLVLISAATAELPADKVRERLYRFLDVWTGVSRREREVQYVETFELSPKNSLYLTSGRSPDKHHRGQELLKLREAYRACGFESSDCELPDYLPVMLEFAAATQAGVDLLAAEHDSLSALERSLADSGSPFADVIASVLTTLEHRSPEQTGAVSEGEGHGSMQGRRQ